jgi:hypothetical protein
MDESVVQSSTQRSPKKMFRQQERKKVDIIANTERRKRRRTVNMLLQCSWFVHPTVHHIRARTNAGTDSWFNSYTVSIFCYRQWMGQPIDISSAAAVIYSKISSNCNQKSELTPYPANVDKMVDSCQF